MYGHPIARELEAWWRIHGARHDHPDWQSYLADLETLFPVKLAELGAEHVNGDENGKRFGMSKAAGCTRAAALKYLGHESEPFSGSTLVTFHIGHLLECMAIASLRACGYQVDGAQSAVTIDPMMHSYSDGIIQWNDGPALLSVKTIGYKKSGKQGSKWVRQGFPALPFDGVYAGQPSWWAQAQAEMHGSGIHETLVLAVAKDIVKAMDGDPYLGDEGNGSLTWYAQLIQYDPEFCAKQLLPVWQTTWDSVTDGKAGPALVWNPQQGQYKRLVDPGDTKNGWGGPNREVTGTFNPCFGCDFAKACVQELANDYKRR